MTSTAGGTISFDTACPVCAGTQAEIYYERDFVFLGFTESVQVTCAGCGFGTVKYYCHNPRKKPISRLEIEALRDLRRNFLDEKFRRERLDEENKIKLDAKIDTRTDP